jgi:hypothetical protein
VSDTKKDEFTTAKNLEAKPEPAPTAAPEGRAIVKVVTSVFDDKGKLRNPGDVFVTSASRAADLIRGQECIDAESEMRRKLDEDQLAVEALKKS